MKNSIFDYKDYKKYLNDLIASKPKGGRGIRSTLASAMGCQTAYITRVLNGSAHISLEQAQKANRFFSHSDDEADFFLLMVLNTRAGTVDLKKQISKHIDTVLQKRLILKDRLDVKRTLSRVDQATYYSAWYYGAIHMMLTVPRFQNKEVIAEKLNLRIKKVSEVLEFLTSVGLAVGTHGVYKVGTTRIHLENDSPMISKHHTNWRIRAIDSMDKKDEREDLHYSSVVSVSNDDIYKIKSIMIKAIEEIRAVVKESKEESVACYTMDFFDI